MFQGATELGAKLIPTQYDVTVPANFRGISSDSKTPSTPNSQTQSSKNAFGRKRSKGKQGKYLGRTERRGRDTRAWGKDPHPHLQLSRFRCPPASSVFSWTSGNCSRCGSMAGRGSWGFPSS